MNNRDLASVVLQAFEKMEVRTLCICPGARNSPLVDLLSENTSFEKFYFFDERSAGFFALGRAKLQSSPVAVLTTSGTAAGELTPSVMEAYYSHLPLVVVTADRPDRYRGTGAPQTAEQVGIYGVYAEPTIDWSKDTADFTLKYNPEKPLHLNICFDEPLIQKENSQSLDLNFYLNKKTLVADTKRLKEFLEKRKNPLVILGGLTTSETKAVAMFLHKSKLPFYAEGVSQLRESTALQASQIFNVDNILKRATESDYPIDGILRIGDVPTHRIWRDLEAKTPLPVLSISSKNFSGLPKSDLIYTKIENELEAIDFKFDAEKYQRLKTEDYKRQKNLISLFEEEKLSEPAQVYFLSHKIQKDDFIYLGNSLPIREWDLAANFNDKKIKVGATRGLNGIDGQISYFLGNINPSQTSWALLGDLTTLYDLQGPWILKQLQNFNFKIIILNNGGGKIFDRMFRKKDYLNEHQLNFSNWAQMWELSYESLVNIDSSGLKSNIIEVTPETVATTRFWKKYESL